MTGEEWREYPEDPNYLVSSYGRVARLLQGTITHHGYRKLYIANKEIMAQRVVARTFHGPPPFPKADAAHDDGNKLNNTPANVYWKTRSENIRDKRRHGSQPFNEDHHWAKITMKIANEIRAAADSGLPTRKIADQFGVDRKTVRRIVQRAERGGWRDDWPVKQ